MSRKGTGTREGTDPMAIGTRRVGPSKGINCFALSPCEDEPWKTLRLRDWNRKSGAGERTERCLGVTEGNGMGCGVLSRDGACRGWVCPSHTMPSALRGRGQTRSILSPNVSVTSQGSLQPMPTASWWHSLLHRTAGQHRLLKGWHGPCP